MYFVFGAAKPHQKQNTYHFQGFFTAWIPQQGPGGT